MEILEIPVTLETLFESKGRRIKCTVSDCFEREIARLESLGKYNSASKVKTVFSLIGQFRNADIRLEEIDLVYLNDLELFLRKRGNKDNSIATKFSVFHADLQQGAGGRTLCAESQSVRKVQSRSALDGYS